DGEYTSEVLDGSAVLSMSSLELVVSLWVAGEPSDVGHADDIAVQVGLQNAGAAGWAAVGVVIFIAAGAVTLVHYQAVSSGLDLGGLLQVLCMGVHLSQHSADSVVLDAQLLYPLLVVCTSLVRDGHVLELSFLGEVDVVHGAE